ncbi:unnamed protein product [Prorocentrum cordatum]|uniref:Transmembrane 9 superfamily member n=1 Tax=Prorocentrum cordatum TaxID=2364126 RepID=A0ABN9VX81_9DINO|nr:unnamed protein product [Polarella glacialis]
MGPRPGPAALLWLAGGAAQAFYLPGVAPREYLQGNYVELKVNKLTSAKTQLPYSFYTLPHCPPDELRHQAENLGEILVGDIIENSKYQIQMLENESCKVLCRRELRDEDRRTFRTMIDDEYLVNWLVDSLPAATRYADPRGTGYTFMNGFPVGTAQNGTYYVHNHVLLSLQFHSHPDLYEGYRVVGFEVQPSSLKQSVEGQGEAQKASCSGVPKFDLDGDRSIVYTYDVLWTWSDTRWASRWDTYLKMTAGKIHWFSLLNSLVVVFFLTGLVAMILLRTLCRDIAKYNEKVSAEQAAEESGWKLVHADVFRQPDRSKLFVASVGSGFQILLMSIVTLAFSLMGLLSPAHRGSLLQSMMLVFTLMGVSAGYVQARLYKVLNGEAWRQTTLLTAFLWPGAVFAVFFALNLLIWGQKSSGAVPFTTMFLLLALWFCVSVPLVFLGSWVAMRRATIELPVRTSAIARQIPEQSLLMRAHSRASSVAPCPSVPSSPSCSSSCPRCGSTSFITCLGSWLSCLSFCV